ncbi:MAG: hypothetical protein RL189_2853 [Pseudomonadota bacterium]|jgi:hypothetical protein
MTKRATKPKAMSNANEVGQSGKLQEGKVVRSRNFYPTHYLNEVFAEDVAGLSANGKSILQLRQDALKTLATISDAHYTISEAEDNLRALARQVINALGFYEHNSQIARNSTELTIENAGRGRSVYSLNLETRVHLKDGSEIWIVTEPSVNCNMLQCETILEASCSIAMRETDNVEELKWRELINQVFDSDHFNVTWLLLSTGTTLCLFERNRWIEEHEAWLEADLRELWELNSPEHAKMVDVLFSSKAFAISSPESWHNLIATNAHKKATEVSRALRDTVRQSVELLANEVLALHAKKKLAYWHDRDLEKAEDRDTCSRELFEQVLRVVYRMLFILVVEGQPQSKRALPIEAQAYQQGISLEKLRDLENITLVGDAASSGSFIWQTLQHQTRVYFSGFNPTRPTNTPTDDRTDSLGFCFPQLGIHLFNPASTPLFEDLNISDRTMQQMIRRLSLAQTGTGRSKRTYRVYYGSLSLNRLGEVYEGLLSLRPQILDENMYVLVRDPKEHAPKLLPVSKAKDHKNELFEYDDSGNRIVRQKREFALTPTGFERKLSASYYTPEELTNFLASEAVDCLLGKEERAKNYEEICIRIPRIENLKICEPAMGNGAFCNAVVNELSTRLAKLYVQRAEFSSLEPSKFKLPQVEMSKSFEEQRGRAKEHILRNGVYGVDLNPTAVELARVSLWLNALHKGGDLPYLDLKLRCGNSLVGAWIKRYRTETDKAPHFLFPMPEMLDAHLDGKFLGNKRRPFLNIDERAFVQSRKSELSEFSAMRKGISDLKLKKRLLELTNKIDTLFDAHAAMRTRFQDEVSKEFSLSPASRELRAMKFFKEDTAYNQLRGMMDLWCSLWFWPHSEIKQFPTTESFLQAMEFFAETPCAYGGPELEKQIAASGLKFLSTARSVSLKERFFHWELEFPEVFANGGFDLVLGNPPWAPVRWDEGDFFDSLDFGVSATEGDSGTRNREYDAILQRSRKNEFLYKEAYCNRSANVTFLNLSETYEFKDSSTTNTYKFFYQRFLQVTKQSGIHAMIAQDGLVTDDGNVSIRPSFYAELERGYRFWNELQLFSEVDHHVQYFIWLSRRGKRKANFEFIDNLYHPETVFRCRQESMQAPYRGMKDENSKWELRGHPKRIIRMDEERMKVLASITGSIEVLKTSLPIVHGEVELAMLAALGSQPNKLKLGGDVYFSPMFHEAQAPRDGLIRKKPHHGKGIERSVLTGPNVFVANPAFKQPNPGCRNNLDYSEIDLSDISDDFFPHTLYETTDAGLKSDRYNKRTPWGVREVDEYRLVGRAMVGVASERTLSAAICPPKVSHINGLFSLSFKEQKSLVEAASLWSSLVLDFLTRSMSGGNCNQRMISKFPVLTKQQRGNPLLSHLLVRTLRLNCISSHYSELWRVSWSQGFLNATIPSKYSPNFDYSKLSSSWQRNSVIRDAHEREQALCEIDAIVSILFGISKQDLLDLYRSQFGVLQKNLQDFPNQIPDPEKFHFPRYKAMDEAYDACLEVLNKPNRMKLA